MAKITHWVPVLSLALFACVPGKETNGDLLFEQGWKDIQAHYGAFENRQLNWDSVYTVRKPLFFEEMTEQEFYIEFSGVLSELHDANVFLYPANSNLPNWNLYPLTDSTFRKNTIIPYLSDMQTHGAGMESAFINGNIGYIFLPRIPENEAKLKADMAAILSRFANVSGIIIDLRTCSEGTDAQAQTLAGYFCANSVVYMKTRWKSGSGKSDFTPELFWTISPQTQTYTGTVVALTGSRTRKAGESFLYAVATQPHVKTVGDTTAGAVSQSSNFELNNAWYYSISIGDYRSPAGIPLEGAGFSPVIPATNTTTQLNQGTDAMLEAAINQIP